MTRRYPRDYFWALMHLTAITGAAIAAVVGAVRAAERDVVRWANRTGDEGE